MPAPEPGGHLAIRLATSADAAALARLRWEFRSALNEATEDEAGFVARCGEWMAARLAAGSAWRCWVVEAPAREISGNLWLQLIEKVPNPVPELEHHAYITNVYLQLELRGSGAGELLVETALAWCRERGVDSVVLWPTPRSRTLYARHGFAVRDDVMEAILDPGRDLVGH
ncbi:MAG: GNAT family N-acetyltransferase [Chloroflexi bacterium]|nr:GNAT family N-acetyltransferase [Chloroflexota bacterium]